MRLDLYLFDAGLVKSRSKAKQLIEDGRVTVNGKAGLKPSFDVTERDDIKISEDESKDFVGRGGLKIEAALDHFGIDVGGKMCVDIGASTGGFTQCLLRRGAGKVYAIDSGKGQLALEIKNDVRVVSLEGVNARYMDKETIFGDAADVAVMDVSFISQKLIYPALSKIIKENADIVTLIKPQFEAGRENIGKNGIVKDEKVHRKVIEDIKENAALFGFETVGVIDSPIKGGSGNKEYLIYFKNRGRA